MTEMKNVIVSKTSFESNNHYDIINSNITVVNLILEEGGNYGQVLDESLMSYFVDYYLSQVNNGNFSQFVYNSRWSKPMNDIVMAGLEKMGAKAHLEYFMKQKSVVESLDKVKLESFFKNEYFGKNETRDNLNNDDFFDINRKENLIDLNSKFLKGLPNLKVLSIDEMFQTVEDLLEKPINRN